jgi:magnesium-transporting ATPase (P-type)
VKQCQPLSRPYEAACIIGQNYVPIEVPSFVEAWLLELSKPFYVFQFMCCVLWTIDNYIPYGYGLMFLLFLGSSQAAYVTIRSKKDMRALVDKRYDVEVLRQGGWTRIDRCELLPGDVVKILAGAPVPADCILMSGSVLMDESMLTGEALPLSKSHLEHMDDKVYTPDDEEMHSIWRHRVPQVQRRHRHSWQDRHVHREGAAAAGTHHARRLPAAVPERSELCFVLDVPVLYLELRNCCFLELQKRSHIPVQVC